MTIKELKELLSQFDENLEVKVCDYNDDSDERAMLQDPKGAEILTDEVTKTHQVVAIYYHA